jgi:hypothetical protein
MKDKGLRQEERRKGVFRDFNLQWSFAQRILKLKEDI